MRAKLNEVVEKSLDHEHLRALLEERALARDAMDAAKVRQIREEMERAEARRLQPHFIASFFREAFALLGGTVREREPKRYEITHVPAAIRSRDRLIGSGEPVLPRYERITFEKDLIAVPGKPLAAFICPGHPLLDCTIDLLVERHRDLLKRGAVLIDDNDPGERPRVLVYLEHSIQDARTDAAGQRRIVSRQMQFVEVMADGGTRPAGYAPYLDLRPPQEAERIAVDAIPDHDWLLNGLEARATEHAIAHIVPQHIDELRSRKEELVDRTIAAVKDRLTKEINFWDHRATQLRQQEEAGRTNMRLNSAMARQRADDLTGRLERRLAELEQERRLSPLPPVVIGAALVVPAGLIARLTGQVRRPPTADADRDQVEAAAMRAVMETERRLGYAARDVSASKCGYDIESVAGGGRLRFIEVKGRAVGARTVTITKNEILTGLNKPDDFILALVEVDHSNTRVRYVRCPFVREPDFGVTSVNYDWDELTAKGADPS